METPKAALMETPKPALMETRPQPGLPSVAAALPACNGVILYDGVCGLCNRFVQFVLRWDASAQFLFAPLQGEYAKDVFSRHASDAGSLETVVLVLSPGTAAETLLLRSDAAAEVFIRLGGGWRAWGRLLRLLPRAFRDAGYSAIARNRYWIFGKMKECPLPGAQTRARFLP